MTGFIAFNGLVGSNKKNWLNMTIEVLIIGKN
jgi:hypothetical protein